MFKILLTIFCFFGATGSFPIDVFGAKLSNVFTLAFCAAMPAFLVGHRLDAARLAPLTIVGTIFVLWQTASAMWAPDMVYSAYRALVVNGYMFLALALPIACAQRRIDMIQTYGRVALGASALLVATSAIFLPLGARAVYPQLFIPAFALEPLDDFDLNDPNIVACALSVGLICALETMRDRRVRALAICVFAIAILLTQSRTALVFLPASACLAAIATRQPRAMLVALVATAALAGVALAVYQWLGNLGDATGVADAFQDRFLSDSASNDDRLERLQNALAALSEPMVALFGFGAGGSIFSGLEPHNMFLSFFLELGVFGLALFCTIFVLVGGLIGTPDNRRASFHHTWLWLFVLLACLTYWHTRTLWFSLSLIVFASLQKRLPPRTRRFRDAPDAGRRTTGGVRLLPAP